MAVTIKSAISSVKWDNFGEHMLKVYAGIYENLQHTDCQLILADGQLRASRVVLGMASSFFDTIFSSLERLPVSVTEPCAVLIPDVTVTGMRYILQFIHTGEVKLQPEDMTSFLDACYLLHIRGLKSNDGRVEGAGIRNSCNETHEASFQEGTTILSDSSAYIMSVANAVGDEIVEARAADQSGGATVGQIILQTTDLGEVCTEVLPITKDPGTQYYDAMEDDGMNVDAIEQHDDDEDGPFEESANLSCIDTFMAESVEEIKEDTADKGLSKEESSATYAERLEMAVNAIVNCGTSFRTASVTYNIPKTVLWRRAIKISRLVKPQPQELPSPRREAIEAIKAGEKLLSVSRRFDIPISTLHRDKIRLYSEGGLPDTVALKQRDKGDKFKERLVEAAQKYLTGSISLSDAVRMYSLPKTTIWRKIRSLRENPECSGSSTNKRSRTKQTANSTGDEKNIMNDMEAESNRLPVKQDVVRASEEATKMKVQHMPSNYVFM